MSARRLAIFDCDGTLVDSHHNIGTAMAACFAEAGLPEPPRAETRRIIGLSLTEAMAVLHPQGCDTDHRDLAERYKGCFQRLRAEGKVEEPLFDGVLDALARMEADGWTLGVATGKSGRGLQLALEGCGLGKRFVTLQTADRHPSKPHPSMIHAAIAEAGGTPERTVMIGDTSFDIRMARAAHVHAVGVAWGYHDADELREAGAQAIADHPSDLPGLCAAAVAS